MKLNLKKPIVFFDLETTGKDIISDRIVEICFLKISPDGKKQSRQEGLIPEYPFPLRLLPFIKSKMKT